MQNDELRETELQLLDANQRYRDLFETAPIAYVSLDRRGRITGTNHGACELLASTRRQRERELCALLDAVADGVFSFDGEGIIVLRSEIVGSTIDEISPRLTQHAIDVSIRRVDEESFVAVLTRAR